MTYVRTFFPADHRDDKEIYRSFYFEPLQQNHGYDKYLFVLLHQKQASGLTEPLLKKWGIAIRERGAVEINPCSVTEHGEHEHLLPFYKDNRQLLLLLLFNYVMLFNCYCYLIM